MKKWNSNCKFKLLASLITTIIIILGLLFTNNNLSNPVQTLDVGLIDVIEPFITYINV